MLSTVKTPSSLICTPVAEHLGAVTPADQDFAQTVITGQEPEFQDEIEAFVQSARWQNASTAPEYFTGKSAEKAIHTLGCLACPLVVECEVAKSLHTEAEVGMLNEKTAAILDAPSWVQAVRLERYRQSHNGLPAPTTKDAIMDSLQTGLLNPDELTGGIQAEAKRLIAVTDLPDYSHLKIRAANDTTLESFLISLSGNSDSKVEVIDASGVVESGVDPVSKKDALILFDKLAQKITSVGANGLPQVLEEDGTILKHLRDPKSYLEESTAYEVRAHNKARLYILVQDREKTGTVPRVVVLGSSQTESDQDKCINHMFK